MFANEIDFIRSLYGNEEFIPLYAPTFAGNENRYLKECIDSTFVSSVGEFVNRFECDVARFTGARSAVVCVNGTSALHIALMMCGVERGDEVITQALTFIATANAISYCGASPVFVDVDMETMGLSPQRVREWLEANAEMRQGECFNKITGARIKACVPMHTFGHPMRIDELVEVCQRWGLELVEDAAESIGSYYKGQHTGTFGRVGVLSFNGNKTITTGGGGMLLFNDEELAARCKHLTTQAKVAHRWEFVHDQVGYNYRMPNINAALGCAQLEQLPSFLQSKRQTAQMYRDFFEGHPTIRFMTEPVDSVSNYWLCAVLLPDRAAQQRFLEQTNSCGVMTRPVWELMSRLDMFKDCQNDGLSNSIYLADRVVNIPSSVR